MGGTFKVKKDKDVKEIRRIESDNTKTCPFCQGKDIRGGSWSPDICMNCRAVYFFGSWWEK